ncbi:hypothetical protein SORBI_3003G124750 [Sorghum bicolor]|uniref:Uncharacterized protein n=1 Tax=Sorghum bicolor TaxID=4558 RepID=A0A1W0VX43_SORBI|nr:hypothetical protein SORBI_3003G124750 [Sorghum bicolor]
MILRMIGPQIGAKDGAWPRRIDDERGGSLAGLQSAQQTQLVTEDRTWMRWPRRINDGRGGRPTGLQRRQPAAQCDTAESVFSSTAGIGNNGGCGFFYSRRFFL